MNRSSDEGHMLVECFVSTVVLHHRMSLGFRVMLVGRFVLTLVLDHRMGTRLSWWLQWKAS